MEPSSELALALTRAHKIAKSNGGSILRSEQLQRSDRELLLRLHWLQEIIKGWYLLTSPNAPAGDSTIWYANFWEFLHIYLGFHLDESYCLSAESSLDLHTKTSIIPHQVIVIAPTGRGAPQQLPFQTSVLIYADPSSIPEEREVINGLQVMELPYALCKVSPIYFQKNPKEAEIALRLIQNASELSAILIKHNFKTAAKRLIGAYKFLKNEEMANNLKNELLDFGWKITEENPFVLAEPLISSTYMTSPYSARILSLWSDFRPKVLAYFPDNPKFPLIPKEYIKELQEIYMQDAYNSLSIEGYHVNENLIAKVQKQDWNPDLNQQDSQERNAL
ncbi:MAG: hypothetical protein NTX49_08080, partial [Chlamydiae bacterium]|nr:hypothetical protein [Chlamydiota bacterium]